MRIATTGAAVGALVVVAGLSAWLVLHPWHRPRAADHLPAWFGDKERPAARIAGKVFGVDHPITVELRLDVPDPKIWGPLRVRTSADGQFDFGAMRPGPYLLLAIDDHFLSRIVHVNTLRDPGEKLELFAYQRSAIEKTVSGLRFAGSDEDVLYRILQRVQAPSPGSAKNVFSGTVVRADGTPAADVGVQPVGCQPEHGFAQPLPRIATTTKTGAFAVAMDDFRDDVCFVNVWLGPAVHEVEIDRYQQDVAIRLPPPGQERHGVVDPYRRDRGDPRGAWIRGRVVHDGRGVPDADLGASVLPFDNMEVVDEARTRSDGTFELYISSRDLGGSDDVMITAAASMLHLRGRATVHVSPGQTRDGVTIEIGAGVTVSGVVVDERRAPIEGAHVACEAWRTGGAATRSDGRFELTVPTQGRCRLHVVVTPYEALAPVSGVERSVDVIHPDGRISDVRLQVMRDTRHQISGAYEWGYVDLGAEMSGDTVKAVSDELAAAGLRPGDTIVSATHDGQAVGDEVLHLAALPSWGEQVALTVKRGEQTLVITARAPTFAAD